MARASVESREKPIHRGARGSGGGRAAQTRAGIVLALTSGLVLGSPGWARGEPLAAAPARIHRVQAGETLWSLARRYGVSVEALITTNRIRDVRRVPVGLRLRIPGAGSLPNGPGSPEEGREPRPSSASAPTRSPAPEAPAATLAEARASLVRAEAELREARFEEALERVARGRRTLGSHALRGELRARLEIVAGTAEVALGRTGDALASFGRALTAAPALRLDPARTSPKVVRVFEHARQGSSGPPGPGRPAPRAGALTP